MGSLTEIANEAIDHISSCISGLSLDERIMLLGYVAENCKAHEETILAYEYHAALYPRKAKPIILSDGDTDCATGHCECGNCHESIDPWDKYCRHCGMGVDR